MPAISPSPRLLKGGLVLLDPATAAMVRVVALQYNPDSLSRTLQAQTVGANDNERAEPLRFKGPPVETLKLEAEIDATDQLEKGDDTAGRFGILPQLAALEAIVYPTSEQLVQNNRLADSGTLEIAPVQAPLCLFVWSEKRIVPVRVTDFSVTEEAFDPNLNPIRARVSLGLRVLSVTDLGFGNKGGSLYLEYQRQKEQSSKLSRGAVEMLGLRGPP